MTGTMSISAEQKATAAVKPATPRAVLPDGHATMGGTRVGSKRGRQDYEAPHEEVISQPSLKKLKNSPTTLSVQAVENHGLKASAGRENVTGKDVFLDPRAEQHGRPQETHGRSSMHSSPIDLTLPRTAAGRLFSPAQPDTERVLELSSHETSRRNSPAQAKTFEEFEEEFNAREEQWMKACIEEEAQNFEKLAHLYGS
jgi:hypothetical protein